MFFYWTESIVSDLVLFCVGYEAIGLDCLCGIRKRIVVQCSFTLCLVSGKRKG
jgi:hypothetical protein